MDDYKVGDCITNIHSKELCVIVKSFVALDGIKVFGVKKLHSNYKYSKNLTANQIKDLYIKCPVAQVLYTNNSNKAVTNETDEE